jgi:energy-coupling factor transporter ATP-binding protein EcfA2
MADKLIVKNFGPIRAAEMEIKKTTLLIGPQGSGKSTLAKLVAMITNKPNPKQNNFAREALDYGMANYGSENTNILYDNFPIVFKSNGQLFDYLEFGAVKNGIFIPTERLLLPMLSSSIMSLLSSGIALPKYLTNFGAKYEYSRKYALTFEIDYLDLEYQFKGEEYIAVKGGKPIKLSESASGYQSIIPIKLVVENYRPELRRSFIIEEPELNLFPTTQKNLIYYLADRCTKNDNELLMTTHSPYVLAALNNLLFAHKIASEKPHNAADVAQVIPRNSWLNPNDFAAYYVADGTVRSIINPKTGLISENELDDVSDLIGEEFNQLVDIYRLRKNETIA